MESVMTDTGLARHLAKTKSGVLTDTSERSSYNRRNGQFLPGHVPFNKGKKWSEYVGKRVQKRMAKGWVNLQKFRPTTRPVTAGRNKKACVALLDDGRWRIFPSIAHAGEWLKDFGGKRENISRCCQMNEERHINLKTGKVNTNHKYKDIRWYYESDDVWMQKVEVDPLNF